MFIISYNFQNVHTFFKNNDFLKENPLMKKSEVSLTKVATNIKEKGNKNMSYAKKMFEEK